MEDQTTLNPVPRFDEYTWKETKTNNGTSAIIVNASISSELPYEKRNITVKLGTNIQSKVFNVPLESVTFAFDGLDPEPKEYPLKITFMLVDYTIDHRFTAINMINGIVKTTAHNMGNKQFLYHSLFLIVSITFVLL
ncbi:unnamed protein product [Rotaria sordida]|uniref:Uncharacterized protein n=1 Tax=Rotaria sordida TaxID=392033 RepID=A0A814NWA8_9BILA|nr:unnamed protein product [Rotaria sordida]CAF1096704.1 unnamed protein product [Rotaria sordida]